MISTLNPGEEARTPFGICKVMKAITWRKNGEERVFGYSVLTPFDVQRFVHIRDIERLLTAAQVAWAAAKVRAVVENKVPQ
jgi:hypothetical protein